MATIPTPATIVAGAAPTAAALNSYRDGINFLYARPLASVWNTLAQPIATGTTTPLTWDSDEIDNDGIHSTSTNTERLTIVTPGVYVPILETAWQASSNAVAYANSRVYANIGGTGRLLAQALAPWVVSGSVSGAAHSVIGPPVRMAAGDYFYALCAHGWSSAVNVNGGQYVGSRFGLYLLAT